MHDRALLVKHLGRCDYLTVWQAMREFTDRRQPDTPDELWLLEHHPVYTQGLAGEEKHLLNPGLIPIIHTDRGGQVTYHGPGQLVCYLLFDITRMEMGTRTFVRKIEDAVIRLLNHHYDIPALQRCDAPGVYVEEAKICSLGLRVRKGKSYHGLALNVDMDLEPFTRINPCGFNQLQMTQIADFKYVQMENVIRQLTDAIIHVFGYEIKVMIHRPEITRPHNTELAYA